MGTHFEGNSSVRPLVLSLRRAWMEAIPDAQPLSRRRLLRFRKLFANRLTLQADLSFRLEFPVPSTYVGLLLEAMATALQEYH